MTKKNTEFPVSVSSLDSFQKCARAWIFRDKHWGLGFSPVFEHLNVFLGRWIHGALHYYYNSGVHPAQGVLIEAVTEIQENASKLSTEQIAELKEWSKKCARLMQAYVEFYKNYEGTFGDRKLKFLKQELSWSLDVGGHPFHGRFDGLVEVEGIGLFVFETKTSGRTENLSFDFAWQPRVYTYVAQELYGEPVLGVVYNLIRLCDPYDVKLLKNGMPSRAQSELAGVTPETYEAAVQAATGGEVPPEYQMLIDLLRRTENSIFNRQVLYISEAQLAQVPKHLVTLYEEIDRLGKLEVEAVPPTLNPYNCNGYFPCAFRHPCAMLDDGGSWLVWLEENFKR